MSFPPVTEMFQFTGFASPTYVFSRRSSLRMGLPHSEIHGSTGARPSPRLIAACYVLHRLSVPRHPPDALIDAWSQQIMSRTEKSLHEPEHRPPKHITSPRTNPAIPSAEESWQDARPGAPRSFVNPYSRCPTFPGQAQPGRPNLDLPRGTTRTCHQANPSPMTGGRHSGAWWRRTGSNRRPPACKAGALPAELNPHYGAWWVR